MLAIRLAGLLAGLFVVVPVHATDVVFRSGFSPPGECAWAPPGMTRQTTAVLQYIAAWRFTGADVTQFANIWGRYSPDDPILPWPLQPNSLVAITNFGRYQYVSAQFTVPVDPPFDAGRIARGDTLDTVARTSASISESCGDFSDAVPDTCRISGAHQASTMLQWSINGIVPGTCPLTTGHTYYLNLMMAPIGGGAWYCSGATCQLSVVPYGL